MIMDIYLINNVPSYQPTILIYIFWWVGIEYIVNSNKIRHINILSEENSFTNPPYANNALYKE